MSDKRPILLATDGSPSARAAEETALELAQRLDAELLVVSVDHPVYPASGYYGYGVSDAIAEFTKAERVRVQELLAAIKDRAEAAQVPCTTMEADGTAVDAICDQATAFSARLIVVGSHGWGAARRLFSGSVSTGLVHSAPCPVLVVRSSPQAEEHAAAA
jgi:nucleotide-binding universal stress UspA family protein